MDYVRKHTEGFDEALQEASIWRAEKVAEVCDVDIQSLNKFFEYFTQSDKAVSFYSMGVNQSSSGVDKANAIINCHLATGQNRPGGLRAFFNNRST